MPSFVNALLAKETYIARTKLKTILVDQNTIVLANFPIQEPQLR